MKKNYFKGIVLLLGIYANQILNATPLNDELVTLHAVSTAEMHAIDSVSVGSLIFNTDDKTIYEHNTTQWKKLENENTETNIISGKCTEVTGTGSSASPYIIKNNPPAKKQATAGTTCKQILDIGCPVPSGMYWINPSGGSTANAVEVYCDMTTDGGGWTRIDYASDLPHINRWDTGDQRRWLPSNFSLVLTDTQINNIRNTSTEGKQTYRGTSDHVMHYFYNKGGHYGYAFGFRYHTGFETSFGQETYPNTDIVVIQDGGYTNSYNSADTVFEIHDIRVPIVNVNSRDSGNPSERFGSPLTSNPAWLR